MMDTIYRPSPLPSLVQIAKPERVPVAGIMRRVDDLHPSRLLLQLIVRAHPAHCITRELIRWCGYSGHRTAALAWHVLRVNDSLPMVGWKIDVEGDRHFLIPISERFHQSLVERYERRRVA